MTDKPKIKVGDQIAFCIARDCYRTETVKAITPSGRIVVGNYTLNPDLTIRGKKGRGYNGPYRAEIVTDEIRESIQRRGLIAAVRDLSVMDLRLVSTETLQQLAALRKAAGEQIDKAKSGGKE